MRLPDPVLLKPEFQRRGFVLVPQVLDADEQATLFDVALALVRHEASTIDRTEDHQRLWYTVVPGDRIAARGAPLFAFYTHPDMLSWIRAVSGSPSLGPSSHLQSAINVNCLQKAGQRYPWHRDAVPYTSVLFLSSVPASAGGSFMIRAADEELVHVQPTRGVLLFMDGTRCEHAVSPLTENTLRLTVPMVYPDRVVDRPEGLDGYLYGT